MKLKHEAWVEARLTRADGGVDSPKIPESVITELSLELVASIQPLIDQRDRKDAMFYQARVQPILEMFTDLHSSYIERFKAYRMLLDEGATSVEALVDRVTNDRRFEMHRKCAVLHSLSTLSDAELISSLRRYILWTDFQLQADDVPSSFDVTTMAASDLIKMPNPAYVLIRSFSLLDLLDISAAHVLASPKRDPLPEDELRRRKAIALLDRITAELQVRYSCVCQNIQRLRMQHFADGSAC
jgi:hypothetical protein